MSELNSKGHVDTETTGPIRAQRPGRPERGH